MPPVHVKDGRAGQQTLSSHLAQYGWRYGHIVDIARYDLRLQYDLQVQDGDYVVLRVLLSHLHEIFFHFDGTHDGFVLDVLHTAAVGTQRTGRSARLSYMQPTVLASTTVNQPCGMVYRCLDMTM